MSKPQPKPVVVDVTDVTAGGDAQGVGRSKAAGTAKDAPTEENRGQKQNGPKYTPEEREERRRQRQKEARQKNATASPDTGNAATKQKKRAGRKNAPAEVVEVAPLARRARMRGRHWGLVASLVFHVMVPLFIAGWYIWERTEDRFASTVAFTVQQEQATSLASPLTDAFSALGNSGSASDANILYEYLQSQQLVEAIDAEFDLRAHYTVHWEKDPIFSLEPDASVEELVAYWPEIIRISYDEGSGLIELQAIAYDPEYAQAIAAEVLANSQALINDLNAQSRQDSMRYAQEDLADAEQRLSLARGDLVKFRTRTQIVDPETDLAGRLGIVNTLQQQLAEALIEYDLLAQSTNDSDPRVVQAQRRIDVIRERLSTERSNVSRGQENDTGEDYPTLLAEYEELATRREIAEEFYRGALTSMEAARADAARQSRYLAAYISPTLPQTATYPERFTLMALITLFAMLTWTIGVLIYYSVRDSR